MVMLLNGLKVVVFWLGELVVSSLILSFPQGLERLMSSHPLQKSIQGVPPQTTGLVNSI